MNRGEQGQRFDVVAVLTIFQVTQARARQGAGRNQENTERPSSDWPIHGSH